MQIWKTLALREINRKEKLELWIPVKPRLDQWIKKDIKIKKKYRRTAKRMYELLVEQYNFTGSDRSDRLYGVQ